MQIPEKLIQKIKQNNLVVFVGAGLSCKMGYPSWNSLIVDLLGGISDKEGENEKYIQALKDEILNPIDFIKDF